MTTIKRIDIDDREYTSSDYDRCIVCKCGEGFGINHDEIPIDWRCDTCDGVFFARIEIGEVE